MGVSELVILLVGLVVTVVVVGGTLFGVVKMLGRVDKAAAEQQRLLREGVQASARLVAVQMGGMTMTVGVHRHLQLHLQLEVHPPGQPPYPAMLTTMVSELQIPQLQPGAPLTVRIDRQNPANMAIEAAGAPAPQAYQGAPAGFGQPGMHPGMPGMHPGMVAFAPAPVVPGGARVGLWIGVGGAILGVVVAVVVVLVNVVGVGLGGASEGDDVCAQAVRCCEVATASTPSSQRNCKNMGKLGVPKQACTQTLEAMRSMAAAQGKTCK
jgi:hypothetical protein